MLLVVLAVLALTGATTAGAQEDPTTTTSESPADANSDIIPEPNSGHEPTEAGDRGGALQIGLFVLIVVAVGGAGAHVVRQSRRARATQSPPH